MIQQIHALSAIYLEHAYIKFNTLLIGRYLKHVVNGIFGNCIDCECFSRASLSISKTSDNAILENYW